MRLIIRCRPVMQSTVWLRVVDILKFNRVLWRGFNHEGEPPTTPEDLADRRKSLSGPHLDLRLCIVVVSPDGEYASYCGMWYDSDTEYALVEPVATDPAYRKNGSGESSSIGRHPALRASRCQTSLCGIGLSSFITASGFILCLPARFGKTNSWNPFS